LLGVMKEVISRLLASPNKIFTFCSGSLLEPPTKASPEGSKGVRTWLFHPTKFSPLGDESTGQMIAHPNKVLT